jgi:Asp-tRNA(Asn)/Glu-tRNA(Gln) amidotransferase B subunit
MCPDHPDGSLDQKLRFLMGRVMENLRGKVPAAEVAHALRDAVEEKV